MPGLREGTTYADLIRLALERHRSRVAFVGDTGSVTYGQAADRVGRTVAALAASGVRPGDGVAVLGANTPAAWMAWAAAAVLGARFTALQPVSSDEDRAFVCEDGEISTVVFEPAFDAAASRLGDGGRRLLALGPSEVAPDLATRAEAAPPQRLRPTVGEDDPSALLYTGGTTGTPKGVLLSHRAFAEMVFNALCDFELPPEVRYLAASPITHAATIMVVPTLLRGGTVHLHPRFDPERFLATIERERITLCFGVPTMVYRLLGEPALARTDTTSLRTFVYGAAPMGASRLAEALGAFGPVFTQFYGQTESAGTGTVLAKADHDPADPGRLLSCGTPGTGVRLRVVDADDEDVAPGNAGEICLQGRGVMDRYWGLPDLTTHTLRGGWLHTGDVATVDDDGFVTIVDRARDAIVTGGFTVFPRQIEDVLRDHPAVHDAAVIGVPDETWGEAVKAVVALQPGAVVDPAELVALVRRRRGPVHAPKSVDVVDAIPLTPTGKADKAALRRPWWEGQPRNVG
ncbi:MAG: AMP-binding protein [Acidimicrobiales bacterium]